MAITRQGLATNLGGMLQFWSFQATYADVTDTAATTKTMDLYDILTGPPYNTSSPWQLTRGSVVLYLRVKASVAFAGTAITSLKVSLGKSGSTSLFLPPFELTTAVADGNLIEVFNLPMGQLSGFTPILTWTSVGGNLSAMTAGTVNFDLLIVPVTTPNVTPTSSSNVL